MVCAEVGCRQCYNCIWLFLCYSIYLLCIPVYNLTPAVMRTFVCSALVIWNKLPVSLCFFDSPSHLEMCLLYLLTFNLFFPVLICNNIIVFYKCYSLFYILLINSLILLRARSCSQCNFAIDFNRIIIRLCIIIYLWAIFWGHYSDFTYWLQGEFLWKRAEYKMKAWFCHSYSVGPVVK